jgi:hypothetical protein
MTSKGLSCCRRRPRAVSMTPWALVTVAEISSGGASLRKAACQAFHCCCSANHTFRRFPNVLTFAVTVLLTLARASPALSISALSCGSRPARGSVEAFSSENCPIYPSTAALTSLSCCSTRERSPWSAINFSRLARRPDKIVVKGIRSASSGTAGGCAVVTAGGCAS